MKRKNKQLNKQSKQKFTKADLEAMDNSLSRDIYSTKLGQYSFVEKIANFFGWIVVLLGLLFFFCLFFVLPIYLAIVLSWPWIFLALISYPVGIMFFLFTILAMIAAYIEEAFDEYRMAYG